MIWCSMFEFQQISVLLTSSERTITAPPPRGVLALETGEGGSGMFINLTLSQFALWCNYYQYISCFMVFLSSLIFVYNILRLLC